MFEAQKSAQLAGVLLSHAPAHSMDKIKLIKLMYLVDRESFLKVGATVTGDRMVSLPNGPILSASLDSLNGSSEHTAEFKKWIVIPREGHLFSLAAGKDRKDADLLSDFDLAIAQRVWDRFGKMSGFEIVEWTHDASNCPEWQDPGNSAIPITLTNLALALGISSEEASHLESQTEEAERVRQTFASL